MSGNIFEAMFAYRPRDGLTPKENYLTEAFAHVLASDQRLCRAFASTILRISEHDIVVPIEVRTQASFVDPNSGRRAIADMLMLLRIANEPDRQILFEHKWDSPGDAEQIKQYLKVVPSNIDSCKIVFVAPSAKQIADAQTKSLGVLSFLWSDIRQYLATVSEPTETRRQFIEFLDSNGLGIGPAVKSRRSTTGSAPRAKSELEVTLARHTELLASKDWSFAPFRGRLHVDAKPRMRWGRIGLELNNEWIPGVFVGYLCDGANHRVQLIETNGGPDLMMSVDDHTGRMKSNLPYLQDRAKHLRKSAKSVLVGNELRHPHRFLMVRSPLRQVIHGCTTDEDMANRAYDHLRSWCITLFKDGEFARKCLATYPELKK